MNRSNRGPIVSIAPILVSAFAVAGCGMLGTHRIPDPPASARSCAELKGLEMPASAIGLPTRGAVVTESTVVTPAGTGTAALPEHCRVLGEIRPVDPAAP